MRKGLVRISPQLIADALNFPPGWKIENMNMVFNFGNPVIETIISGDEFPEEPNIEGVPIRECRLIVHKAELTYEVKEIL